MTAFMLYHALLTPSRQYQSSARPAAQAVFDTFNFSDAVQHLAKSLRIKTVSRTAGVVSHPEGFRELHKLFERVYPLVHQHLERETVSEFSLLYKWKGSDPQATPSLLMSHMDVVPAADIDLDKWDFEPFAGHVIEEFIYGRGNSRLLYML